MIPSVFRYVVLVQHPSDPHEHYYYGYDHPFKAQITTKDGVTFNFKNSNKSTGGGGNVSTGQLREIFYIK